MLPQAISEALTAEECEQVEKLLQARVKYVDHPVFHPPSLARKKLFRSVCDIPEAEVNWYLSYMNVKDGLEMWNNYPSSDKQQVLSREQEALLFLRFNFAKLKLSQVKHVIKHKGMTLNSLQDLLRWHCVAIALRKHIAEMNLAIVLSVARRHNLIMDGEIIAESNGKLMDAIEHFDISKGNKFSTYVWHALKNNIIRMAYERKLYRSFSSLSDPEGGEIDVCDSRDNPERDVDSEALHYILDHNIAKLTEREQVTIEYRFFKHRPDGSRYVFEDIATMFNVSRTCIQLTERDALLKIRAVWKKLMF